MADKFKSQITRLLFNTPKTNLMEEIPGDELPKARLISEINGQRDNCGELNEEEKLETRNTDNGLVFPSQGAKHDESRSLSYRLKRNPFQTECECETLEESKGPHQITLVVGNNKFLVSKKILAQKSDYFRAMFHSDMIESKQNEIELAEVNSGALQIVLDFLHQGSLHLVPDQVHNVLHIGHEFQLFNVIEACELYLQSLLSKENVLELLDLGDYYCCCRLLKDVFQMLRENFVEFSIRDILIQLKFEHLYALLECDLSIKASEFEILKLVQKWLNENSVDRNKHLGNLLTVIKIPLMSLSELTQLKRTDDPLLTQSVEFKEELKRAFHYKNHPHEQPLLQSWQTSPRGAKSCLVAFSESDAILNEDYTLTCSIMSGGATWPRMTNHDLKLPWCRDEYASTVWRNFLYVAGGYDPVTNRNLSSVHRYDPAMGTWIKLQQMLQRRASFFLGHIGDKLCAVGGRQHDDALYQAFNVHSRSLMTAELYDCTQDSWRKCAPLPCAHLYAHAGAECLGKLYICGGRVDVSASPQTTNAMQCYDTDTDTWTSCPSMSWNRYYHSVISHSDKLYVIGGMYFDSTESFNGRFRYVSDVEIFDPSTNQWTDVEAWSKPPCSMPARRSQMGVAVLEDTIFVLGGLPYPGVDGRNEVLEYKIGQNKWKCSEIKYPTTWPTTCCVLSLKPDIFKKGN